jgi:hypothetical protein
LALLWSLQSHAIQTDKQLHFLVSYSVNTTLISAMPKRTRFKYLKAALVTTSIGVAKELADKEFSNGDLAADLLGVLTSSAIAVTFHF